jgi:hypothetical protein
MDTDDTYHDDFIASVTRAELAKKASPFLTQEQAANYLCLSSRKLMSLRTQGLGPRVRRHSRFIRYHIDDLEAWSKGETTPTPSTGGDHD